MDDSPVTVRNRCHTVAVCAVVLLPCAPVHARDDPFQASTEPLGQLTDLDRRLERLVARSTELTSRRDELDVALAQANDRLQHAKIEGRTARRHRIDRLMAVRRLGHSFPAAVVVGPRTAGDLSRRLSAVRAVLAHDRQLATFHHDRTSAIAIAVREATAVRDRVELLTTEIGGVQRSLASGKADRRALLAAIALDPRTNRLAARELRTTDDTLREVMAPDDEPPEVLGPVRPPTPFIAGRRRMEPPSPGRVRWNFGERVDPLMKRKVFHPGVDVEAEPGTRVYAAWWGRTAFAGWLPGYGHVVILDHGNDWHTVYGHLRRADVRVGQAVAIDTPLGEVGSTGAWNGPHLHFEVRKGAAAQDPQDWLKHRRTTKR